MNAKPRDAAIAQLQLQHGVHPIFWACADGNVQKVRDYLDQGVDVHIEHELHTDLIGTAISTANLEMIKLLIERGQDVNRSGGRFDTKPLHMVSGQPRCGDMARLLVTAGADVNARTAHGFTPLMNAAGAGSEELVVYLLVSGADVHARAQQGFTAFLSAAQGNHPDCLALLLSAGARVNLTDDRGKTALHWAAQRGNTEAVRWLLEHGADKTLPDDSKHTPLDWACENGHEAVASLLF